MDYIADMLIRIKNASAVGKSDVVVPHSNLKEAILMILKKQGFIADFVKTDEDAKPMLSITLSANKKPSHIRQISKPGRRVYVKSKEIPAPLRGFGTVILSTPAGVITGREAKKTGLGGELICEIW